MTQVQENPSQQRVVLLATTSSQSIIAEIVDGKANAIGYTAYGEQSAQQEVVTQLGFNGQLREASIGWYLLGNGYRAYNPVLMRFHSPDSWSPFGGGGLNAYMYCVGDPVNRIDPTGHVPWLEPGVKRFFRNSFNFLFGGSEITGPSRSRAIGATLATGTVMSPVGKGEGRALGTAGVAIAIGAPVKRTQGLYPGGDVAPQGVNWGTTPSYVPSRLAPSGPRSAPQQISSITGGKPVSSGPIPLWNADTIAAAHQQQAVTVYPVAVGNPPPRQGTVQLGSTSASSVRASPSTSVGRPTHSSSNRPTAEVIGIRRDPPPRSRTPSPPTSRDSTPPRSRNPSGDRYNYRPSDTLTW